MRPTTWTLRLEKGDTIGKMLADIDVPDIDRKQIDQALQANPQETPHFAAGEETRLRDADDAGPAGRAARAVAVGEAPTRTRIHRE